MALKSRTWECPDCQGRFTVLLDDRDPAPKFCQCCGADMGEDNEPIPLFGKIGKSAHKSQDQVFRQMESASIERMRQAADTLGVPESELSHMKQTDMKDNLREGDTSYVAQPPAPVSFTPVNAAQIAQVRQQAAAASGNTYSGGRPQGPAAGTIALDKLRSGHNVRAAQLQRQGQEGSYTGGRN